MPWGFVAVVWVFAAFGIVILLRFLYAPMTSIEQIKADNEQVKAISSTDHRMAVRSMWVARVAVVSLVATSLFAYYSEEATSFLKWYMTARF